MEIYVILGNIIREARLEKKMTMKELAKRVGVTESAIHHYEMGIRKMTFDTFGDICKVLGLDVLEVTKVIYK